MSAHPARLHRILPTGLGQIGRERLLNGIAYALLMFAIAIVFFPLLWMLTVSVRPNFEVMKIPPDWMPQVFTL
jgi:multiple sugar transport system permease protein